MSTRSRIALRNEKGEVTSIYCHSGGEPEITGKILLKAYTTRTKIESLLKLGDISYLGSKLRPTKGIPHTFYQAQKDVTFAYHRDRGDELYVMHHKSVKDYILDTGSDIDFYYLYDVIKGKWLYYYPRKVIRFTDLEPVVKKKIAEAKERAKLYPKYTDDDDLPF